MTPVAPQSLHASRSPARGPRWLVSGLLLIALSVPGSRTAAADEPTDLLRIRVPLKYELGEVYALDLERRGRKDLVVVEVDRSRRDAPPQLEVFRHADSGYAAIPGAAEALPTALTLAGVGQFQQGPGLALLTPNGVEVRIWRDGRFRPEPGMALPVESLFPKADAEPQGGIEWLADLNGDGFSELIVPRLDGFTVFTQNAAGALVRHASLRTRPRGVLQRWYRRQQVAYDLPTVAYLPRAGSAWRSIVAYNDGLLNIFHLDAGPGAADQPPAVNVDLQPPTVFDPKAPWDPPLLLVMAEDLNRDGLLDLVFSKATSGENDLNAKTRILVYYGRPAGIGVIFRPEADQVFALEGFTMPILLDLNADGATDLVLVNVEFSFWTAVRALIARSVSAEAAFYRMRSREQYPKKPDDQGSFSVKFALGRFSHQPISLFGDLNGDGLPDLLLSTGSEELGVHWGRKDAFWRSAPDATIKESFPIAPSRVAVQDLDGDGREDLLLSYVRDDIRQMPQVNRTFTVLFSRYPKPGQRTLARDR